MGSVTEESGELRRLVEAARAGEDEARERLVADHLPGLRAYVRLKMRPALRAKESSSDIVQSVCREVVCDLERFEYRGEASFRHWLYRIALNKIIDHQRYWQTARRDAGREVSPRDSRAAEGLLASYADLTTPSRVAMRAEELERIEAAFDRLPEDQREVILLSRLAGLSHREIAAHLDRTEEASRNLLRRALVRLAGLLGQDGD